MSAVRSLLLVAFAAAVSTAAVAAPWSAPAGALISSTLLLVPSLLLAIAFAVLLPPIAVRLPKPRARATVLVTGIWCARDLSLLGACVIIRFVVDAPGGRWTWMALTAVALFSWAVADQVARRIGRGRGRGSFRLGVSWLALSTAVELGVVDALALHEEYTTVHEVLLACGLVLFVLGFTLLASAGPRVRVAVGALATVALAGFGVSALGAGSNPWPAILKTHSAHERVIAIARSLVDRDGDGFSPILGGGDCDDHDANAFPLSTVGRDCLGWMSHRPAPRPQVYSKALPPLRTPTTVVLVTIDAFRCGFGTSDRPELRDLCPGLTRLSRQGWSRRYAHANFPLTARSMTALQTGELFSNPARPWAHEFYLASFFAERGFSTRAIVTHPYVLADAGVRASFGAIDQTLIPDATAPGGATANRVTDRVLDALADARGPTYIWAHYFDPHAPYVRENGDVLTGSAAETYGAELHRTDDAIARLAAALAKRPDAARTILFVTADHGEAFGEHGTDGHGTDLYEEVLRVPMIAWTAGPDHRAFGDAELPSSTSEVAGYLARLFTGEPAAGEGDVLSRVPADGDPQLAVIAKDGWKLIYHHRLNFSELYDLSRDPNETRNLAASEPQRLAALGAELAGEYRALERHKAHDDDEHNLAAAR